MFGFLTAIFLRGDQSRKEAAAQAGKYMVGGAVYFWSSYAIFAFFYSGLHWRWFSAKVLGDIVGWSLNYCVQRFWTFADQASLGEMQHAGRYVFIEAVGFVLDYAIIWGLTSMGVSPYAGFFISAAFFSVWSFLWYKYWVFPEPKSMFVEGTSQA